MKRNDTLKKQRTYSSNYKYDDCQIDGSGKSVEFIEMTFDCKIDNFVWKKVFHCFENLMDKERLYVTEIRLYVLVFCFYLSI